MLVKTEILNQCIKAHEFDAGYDIMANENIIVPSFGKAIISTGLCISVPQGFVGFLKSRSGLSVKHDLEVGAGVIDYGYTGEVKVVLRNFGLTDYQVKVGDKIAQLVVLPIYGSYRWLTDTLEDSERGAKGFNSTGYKHG